MQRCQFSFRTYHAIYAHTMYDRLTLNFIWTNQFDQLIINITKFGPL